MALEHIERRAARISERRKELGLTQEQVAARMQEIHAEEKPDAKPDATRGQMVSDWERAVNSPQPGKLELLAHALETTVADLGAGPIDDRKPKAETPTPFTDAPADLEDVIDRLDAIQTLLEAEADANGELRLRLDAFLADRDYPASAEN